MLGFIGAKPDARANRACEADRAAPRAPDRKSTRLNSSHSQISYAVFCLKKKKIETRPTACAEVPHCQDGGDGLLHPGPSTDHPPCGPGRSPPLTPSSPRRTADPCLTRPE